MLFGDMATGEGVEANPWLFGWEALVAIGTIALAVYTALLAKRTRTLAEESTADQRAQWRPFLVPKHGVTVRALFERQVEIEPISLYGHHLHLSIHNTGRGPALHVRAELQGESSAALPAFWSAAALSPGDVQELAFNEIAADESALQLLLDYRDLTGRSYSSAISITVRDGAAYFYDVRTWEDHTVTRYTDTPYPLPGLTDVSPKPKPDWLDPNWPDG
ncbi:hypothetical protein ACFWJW_30930 [Streptomyces sp. NPDC127097]|uniref:hypothetical protein n=1 Tax=Streptomyces sp. NPDC127097 TaxID=3347136 RepID=UPI00364ECF48